MAALQGVYTAIVTDNRDPDSLARVLVRVSGLDDAAAARGVWARMATMMAGQNRGTFFLPEVGDEVLVAFERGDVRAPCVIGALWNAKARPPATGRDATTTKMIKSRSGVMLRFSDDSASAVVIETPGGQRVTLQDGTGSVRIEDGNGNAITLDASGVTIRASAKVTVNSAAVDVNASAVTVNTGMAKFSGVVQCDTLISNSVISASYSPGAGNIW
ncbi:MAG TPA: phage baseplate assembly protein V [Vicinamibacterales bacterium]|nr:phage baseplate assembly protein V [Vicinamibacterales bacterium]